MPNKLAEVTILSDRGVVFMPSKKVKRRQKRAIFLGITWVLVILIMGTFAMVFLNQMAINPDLVDVFPGGRIHDVFEVHDEDDLHMHGERNKDVFAENFGDIPIGVRVQFREFARIAGVEISDEMDLNDILTWDIFEANAEMEDGELVRRSGRPAEIIGNLGVTWELGQAEDEVKIFMPTFNHVNRPLSELTLDLSTGVPLDSIFSNPHAFQFADASGRAVEALAGNFDIENIEHVLDISRLGVQTGYENHTGLQDFWREGQTHESFLYYIDETLDLLSRREVIHTARATLSPLTQIGDFEFNGVMSLEQWLSLDMPTGNFWIMDTENDGGWFYWNGLLAPGEATSLLLNTTDLPLIRQLEYVIRINADFFVPGNFPDYMSDEAQLIFNREVIVDAAIAIVISEGAVDTVTIGEQDALIAEYVGLRLYVDGVFVQTVGEPVWEVEIIEENSTSSARIGIDSSLYIDVGVDEPNDIIHIRISESRAVTDFILPIEVLN